MRAKLLILDDEPEVLKALQRLLKSHFELYLFDNARDALLFLKDTHCHLILSDMKLPKMNGAEFLSHATKLSPLSKQIVLTGHADIEEAKVLVNSANVSRYYTKPWKNQELLSGLSELITEYNEQQKHKRLIHSLKGAHSKLSSDKEVMSNAIEGMLAEQSETNYQNEELIETNNQLIDFSAKLVNLLLGDVTGHNYRVAQQAKVLAKILGADKAEQNTTYLAGLYYAVGNAILPESLKKLTIEKMSYAQKQQWISSVSISAEILRDIKALFPVADIIEHIYEHIDGSGAPNKLVGDDISLGARILAVVIYHDHMLMGKVYHYALVHEEAMVKLHTLIGTVFDGKVVRAFETMMNNTQEYDFEYAISINKVAAGMVASQDLYNHNEQLLLAKDVVITEAMVEALSHYQETHDSLTTVLISSKRHQSEAINEK
jgi:response regulator RpfG family c-di-GMP phosphodiesterase